MADLKQIITNNNIQITEPLENQSMENLFIEFFDTIDTLKKIPLSNELNKQLTNNMIKILEAYTPSSYNTSLINHALYKIRNNVNISKTTKCNIYIEFLIHNQKKLLTSTTLNETFNNNQLQILNKHLLKLLNFHDLDYLLKELGISSMIKMLTQILEKDDIKTYIKLKELLSTIEIIEKLTNQ